jgi:hypothetical protein
VKLGEPWNSTSIYISPTETPPDRRRKFTPVKPRLVKRNGPSAGRRLRPLGFGAVGVTARMDNRLARKSFLTRCIMETFEKVCVGSAFTGLVILFGAILML